MTGCNKIKEENKPPSAYLRDMDQHALTYGSYAGANPISVPHSIPVTSDNLVVDLDQLYTERNFLPDLNTTDMTSNMSSMHGQSSYYPGWNLDGLSLDSHKTVISDSLISEQINNLVDTKEIISMFYDKPSGDITVQKNREGSAVECNCPSKVDVGFLSLGSGDSTEVKSENCVNWNGGTGELVNNFHVQKAIGGFSGPGLSFDRLSNFQNEAGVSKNCNDHARSIYGSYAFPGPNQVRTLQKTLHEYPTCSIGNQGIIKSGDSLGANLDHQTRFGSDLAASSRQFSSGSCSGLFDFGNIYAYPFGLESKRPCLTALTNTQPNSDQLEMPYIQSVNSFSSESSIVSSSTGTKDISTTQESTGQLPASVSLAAQAANKTAQLPKRKLVQPDGSIYGVNAEFATFGAEVGQIPHSTGVQASESSVLPKMRSVQGQLISHSKNYGISQASDVLGGSSRKRIAKKPRPAAPQVQRKKTVVPPPIVSSNVPIPLIAPSPAAPRVQRKSKAVPSPFLPSVPFPPSITPTTPPASMVQIPNVTAPPQRVRLTKKMVQNPVMPPVPCPASDAPVAPTPASASRPRVTKKTIPKSVLQAVAPKVQRKSKTVPSPAVAPTVQLSNITVPSLVIPSIANPPIVLPTPLAAHRVQRKTTMVPSSAHTSSAPFVVPTFPPPTRVQPTKMKFLSPVIRNFPNIPSAAPLPPVPAFPQHIKWQDPDESPPPLGERCMICKRDLLFTAEGPVFQPAFPPSSAVLPCGHTFHDHCLKNITPQDQATNPPCIPCAIGQI